MNGRNGKPVITDEKIKKVKELVKTTSIKSAAAIVGVSHSTAWKIVNGFFNPKNRKFKPKVKKESQFFEHDKYYMY